MAMNTCKNCNHFRGDHDLKEGKCKKCKDCSGYKAKGLLER